METQVAEKTKRNARECAARLSAIHDALYAIGGKWKLKIIIVLREDGNKRFNELQRSVSGISARVLSNELRELELNGFVRRKVYEGRPVVVEYELTEYSDTLGAVLHSLNDWGTMHREKIRKEISSSSQG
ncbi:winged helix-turn-helix transcriptional regulator [Chitinophaga pinensis]|uniref:Transcriptional regulator, HxlR family n=1 Tax=Chitinophaga pinensis (strain ATCC 43595 / DSM 2588 / LMG 13176 / NBRC 15968 / NCIMB 11800 / UQM 2034) TaxID=485918 RepID=A0A979G1U0_CHIPD|nr:helix-turn-helix domain-containing protein [Chitinophaga pinensis]ACU59186.1 transcriptional regulator, HxlR family [Chitinophaga pinensis DSM 2588]